jgi:glycosyltransferase 2 family protein
VPAAPYVTRMLRWLGAAIAVLSLYYVGRALMGHFNEMLALEWRPGGIAVTVAGTIVYTLGLFALSASWTVIAMAALPDGRQLAIATRIYARSGLAKYLPGNVFHLVGRQVLGRTLGVSQGRLAVATAAEIALSLLSVWLIAAAVFAVLPGPISRGLSLLALALGALAAIAFVSPHLLRRAAPRAAPILDRLVGHARGTEFGFALALNLAFFLCLAMIAGTVFRALTGVALPLMQIGAVYLSAWVAGYVVPGASGGLGVREAALLVLLDGAAGEPALLAFALAMRLQSILGDLMLLAASSAFPLSWLPTPSPPSPRGRHHDPSG